WGPILCVLYYLSGLGFLFWALARRAFTLVRGLTSTRALAFGFYVILFSCPMMFVAMTDWNWENNPMVYVWILYPLTVLGKQEVWAALLWTGTLCYVFGTVVFPFWRKGMPRGSGSSPLPGEGGG
ncbi:MAG TPA: hypothetical protein VNJ09_03110, partial [Chthonomonadales bacterium]|nr:hypothetical protein [Chthonomonadales bacterium]